MSQRYPDDSALVMSGTVTPTVWRKLKRVYCLGDSISTEPYTSVPGDGPNAWPAYLAALLPGVTIIPVATSGKRVEGWTAALTDAAIRDTAPAGVTSAIIVALGVNNLTGAPTDDASTLEDRLALLAGRLSAYGIGPVIGTSITPVGFSGPVETDRQTVNTWLSTLGAGAFAGYIDFSAAIADASDENLIAAAYDGGDFIHPNDAGMAQLGLTAANYFLARMVSSEVFA